MRIAVVGLGGVGAFISASLAKSGIDVIGFARGEHLKKIQSSGLKIVEDDKEWSVKLNAKKIEEADGYFDIVIFCVKSYDLTSAYLSIKQFTDENSILLSLSNGVSHGDTLKKLSSSIVLEGAVYIISHIQDDGVVRKKGKVFAIIFGNEKEATAKLASQFELANLRYKTPVDIKTAIWKKYIFISAFATLTSYYDCSIGCVYEHHKDEAKQLLEEIAEFAHTKGVDIDDEIPKALATASKVPYDSSTSMRLDFQNNKKVELEDLSAYVKTPLMSKMYKKLLEKKCVQ